MTRASTPDSLSTSTASVCLSCTSAFGSRRSYAECFDEPFLIFNGDMASSVQKYPQGVQGGRTPPCRDSLRAASDQHRALRADRLAGVGIAQQHLVMRFARGDHREAVFVLFHQTVEDHRPVIFDHGHDRVIQIGGIVAADAL